jgi:multisubunit Na+/H+ antiporter MnhE subunit
VAFAAEVAVWWALLTGLWLVTLSSLSTGEELVGAGCALVAALAAAGARRAVGGAWRPQAAWARWAAAVVVGVPADTARVLALAARRLVEPGAEVGDGLERITLRTADHGATAAARAALGTFAVSVTPGTVVVDWDHERGEFVVHRLVRGRPSVDREVRR